ncbi:basic leucine zipper 61-like [Zingiber officinale]|uniref:basic leucine zipper 61-like n=1 Tax=Zingiber officinale TaxID=94328 RepID=UPI001C4C93BC|nr:basic leucine zipper 61-like [Zingiber officinale]
MAHLPPKIPHSAMIVSNANCWPPPEGFLLPSTAGTALPHRPSWVDEFLDFSAAKRSHHRRSASDSAAFLEHPPGASEDSASEFDADQLLSLFSDDVVAPAPSDHNSINGDDDDKAAAQKQSANEAQSACPAEPPQHSAGADATISDPKRVKRILANRQSAQRSRVRKLQYISELEHSVTTLQTEVSALSPRVAFLDQQRSLLTLGNSHLKQRIAVLAQDKIFKDAHQEALKKEIERLRQVYQQQNLTTMLPPAAEPAVVGTEQELITS